MSPQWLHTLLAHAVFVVTTASFAPAPGFGQPRETLDAIGSADAHEAAESAWLHARTSMPDSTLAISMPWDDHDLLPEGASTNAAGIVREVDPTTPLDPPTELSFDPRDIRRLPFDLDRVDHPALLHVLEYYATDGTTRAARWIARAGRWRPMIERIAAELDAPRELIWIAAIESGFSNDARSRAGAVGMWQFMERTGRDQGLRIDRWVDERRDPETATRAALAYLQDRYNRFGSWPLAFAAYNAGSGHVRGELRAISATQFWVLDRYAALYGDARRYALRAMALAVIAENRSVFGLDGLVEDSPVRWDTVEVPGGTRLALLAEAAGITLGALQELNPALRQNQTPPDTEVWALRIPAGRSSAFVDAFDRVARRYGAHHVRVPLRVGESIEAFADRVGVAARVIRAVNDLDRHEQPPGGEELIVPGRERRGDDVGRQPEPPARPEVVVVPPTEFRYPDRHLLFYTVLPADTPATIAVGLGVSERELCLWNDLDPSATLWSGMVLQAWVAEPPDPAHIVYRDERHVRAIRLDSAEWVAWLEEQASSARTSSRTRRWTVRAGDTVNGLARRFGVSPRDIVRWNGLGDDGRIRIGDELVVGR
jgi:membrane-bound lytic murein transglycosylase D